MSAHKGQPHALHMMCMAMAMDTMAITEIEMKSQGCCTLRHVIARSYHIHSRRG